MMVIPGAGRNADEYRDAWVRASEAYGVLILSPSYPEKYYPEFWSYNLAGMTRQVTLDLGFIIDTQPEAWNLDDVREELESTVGGHELVGHSAAARLLYQLVLLARAGMLTDVEIRGTRSMPGTRPEQWIFDDFDRIFERVKDALGLETETYDLFGHSAGGQILHRLALFHPSGRADRILAANSGWYTVPTFEQDFPYGLNGSGMTEDRLADAFGAHLVVFLGEEDDADETRGSLRRTPEADRQGAHRLARGKYFFGQARDAAEALGADLEWKLEIVPGIGHDYRRMSQAAAFRTMYRAGGQGLAGPQVGVRQRVVVIDLPHEDSPALVLVNPRIVDVSPERQKFEEGCLSIPGVTARVERHSRVVLEALDGKGVAFRLDAEGDLADCIQHEVDHLDGILYIDRLSPLARQLVLSRYRKLSGRKKA